MIIRQLNFKTLQRIPNQRYASCCYYHSFRHEHQPFDQNPQTNAASTNHSMLNYFHRNLPLRAIDMFSKQLQLHLFHNIDEVTVTLAVKACQGHPKPGCQIHRFTVSSGFASYTTVSNSMMSMYTKAGQFDFSWNTILSGFRTSEGALNFALRMNFNGVIFYPVTCTTVLAFCADHEDFLFGLQLHSLIFKSGLDGEVFVGNAIISMYSRWRRRRLIEARKGNHGLEAIFVFIQMVREGMGFDHVSFTSAVSACGHEMNLELGKQIHGLTIKSGYGNVSVCNALVSTYSKCEFTEDATLVFQCMNDRNVVSWTTMISIDEEDAISLFNEMRLDGVYPNDVTFTGFLSKHNVGNSLITMYAKSESMHDSIKVFEELNCREIISWNALISGYAQNGLCQDALKTFLVATMESKPNNYTFGSVLSAIGDAHDISLKYGQRCHSSLIKLGLVTDPIIAGALLDMYAKRGSICESKRVFSETPHKRVRPDSVTFLSVLTSCSRKGMVEMGRHLFHSMVKDYHIEPSPQHYSSMVDMLGRAGKLEEAKELMSRIPGQPGFSLLQSLLGACRIHGNVEMAERVADTLMRLEPTELGSFVLMSNLYAEKGDWEMVAKVRKGMRDKGVRKEVGYGWVDTGDSDGSLYLHAFSSGDTSHPQFGGDM
ncbi:hypothetical protein PRUPE_5G003100 [Prunus persica]|uniref:Pentacotripeptide-repeat region of PRORP domain-containing protein n=1 Tax=Prunus persica TaxID=3760 RepID=A0A251P2U4_PRUPE|nr:hypothetical protein PRUPE_5G003100 [Prunus persica]